MARTSTSKARRHGRLKRVGPSTYAMYQGPIPPKALLAPTAPTRGRPPHVTEDTLLVLRRCAEQQHDTEALADLLDSDRSYARNLARNLVRRGMMTQQRGKPYCAYTTTPAGVAELAKYDEAGHA